MRGTLPQQRHCQTAPEDPRKSCIPHGRTPRPDTRISGEESNVLELFQARWAFDEGRCKQCQWVTSNKTLCGGLWDDDGNCGENEPVFLIILV